MANIAFAGPGVWNDGGNWVGGTVPGPSDTPTFAAGAGNCTLDIDIEIVDLTFSNYDAEFDAVTFDVTLSGDVNVGVGSATLSMGDGTWTLTSDNALFNYLNIGTLNDDNSTLVFDGTGQELRGDQLVPLYNLVANNGKDVSIKAASDNIISVDNSITINGTIDVASGKKLRATANTTITIGINGLVSGDGTFWLFGTTSGNGLTVYNGQITVATFTISKPLSGAILVPGTYQCQTFQADSTVAGTHVLLLNNGAYVFENNVILGVSGPGDFTLANNTNGPSIIIEGNLTINMDGGGDLTINDSGKTVNWEIKGNIINEITTGTFTWIQGNGLITSLSSGNQTWDLMGAALTDTVIGKEDGNLIFISGGTVNSFRCHGGSINFNQQDFTTSGDMVFLKDGQIIGTGLDGMTMLVGGNLSLNRQGDGNLDLNAGAAWVLDVSGTVAKVARSTVGNSEASGLAIVATNSTDSGSNINWSFNAENDFNNLDASVNDIGGITVMTSRQSFQHRSVSGITPVLVTAANSRFRTRYDDVRYYKGES